MADPVMRPHGFTIVELLITLGIIGVLAAIGGLGGNALLQSVRLNNAVNAIELQVAAARRLAKESDNPVVFSVEQQGTQWVAGVAGRTVDLRGAAVTSGNVSLTLAPPYGTYAGPTHTIEVQVGPRSAEVNVTGVFARTVVTR